MAKSKLFLVVTIILSTSGVEPKALKDAPYPPSGFRPQGRAFNLPGEETTTETLLETTTAFGDDFTTTEIPIPEGVNRLGRNLFEEDTVLTTIKPGIAQYKEDGEKLEIVYGIPASDSLKLGKDESEDLTTATIRPDDEITTFAPVDSEHKLLEDGSMVTKLYPIDEAKLGELRISDEDAALKELEYQATLKETEGTTEITNDEVTTFAPINEEESANLKAQVETIDPQEVSAEAEKLITLEEKGEDDIDPLKSAEKEEIEKQAKENKDRAEEALGVILGTTKEVVNKEGLLEEVSVVEEVPVGSGEKLLIVDDMTSITEDVSASSDEKVILDPSLPAETKFERFYLVNDGKLNDFEYIQQYYDESARDEPLVISQQEVLVPADQPFVYSAQLQRWVS
ncbi:hypothetical protein ACFFRR_011471 [Megaselia abdita]